MEFKTASIEDFDIAFDFIEKLWTYNSYDRTEVYDVYEKIITDPDSFAFFLFDEN